MAFRDQGHEFTEKAIEGILKTLRHRNSEDLYAMVGQGELTSREVLEKVFPGLKVKRRAGDLLQRMRRRSKPRKGGDNTVPIRGLIPGMAVHFAGCCHPLPGDRIVGIVTTGKGVTVHTIDCDTLEQFADTPERWLDVSWDVETRNPELQGGRIDAVLVNAPGSLSTMTAVIAQFRQYFEPENHRPLGGFLRNACRHRGKRRKTSHQHHRRSSRGPRHQFRGPRQTLSYSTQLNTLETSPK